MKIIIENIGIIKFAEYDLADLTIICGRNNTGKTYATYALFGFLDFFNRAYSIKVKQNNIYELINNGTTRIKLDTGLDTLSDIVSDACNQYLTYLPRIFAAQDDFFVNPSFGIVLTDDDISIQDQISHSYRSGKKDLLEIVKNKGENEIAVTLIQGTADNDDTRSLVISIRRILGDAIKDILFSRTFPDCFIASAERTGAVIFKDELNIEKNNLLREIVNTSEVHIEDILDKIYNVSYALPVQRNIAFIRNLESISKTQSELSKLYPETIQLFSKIVGGEYKATSKELMFMPSNGKKNTKLTIGESGSSVRSLLDIYFYLKHIARPGQLLMIDEPEMNLHPESQRKLARLLALLVNCGIKVFITTHSDYIIKELNTLIMLHSRLQQPHISNIIQRYGYTYSELLDYSKVKVFTSMKDLLKLNGYTRRTAAITMVNAVIDPVYGISSENFDNTIDEMNRIQNDILFGE